MRLKGKAAVVTGAARGIGKAIAERFLAEGAAVMICDVLEAEGAATAAKLGSGCIFRRTDVGDGAEARGLIEAAVTAFGKLDICVNNAAILRNAPFLELSEADFDAVQRVNVRGAFLVGQAAAKQMAAQGKGGAIVNLSSINAVFAIPGQTAYTVSKGAIHMLTRSMAVQLASFGIRVNAIGPGTIRTEMAASMLADPKIGTMISARTPLGRPGEPEEIAAIAAFLASDDASYVTGQTIYADGGRLALNLTVSPRA
jgi:glucose 1-dehydrogenase